METKCDFFTQQIFINHAANFRHYATHRHNKDNNNIPALKELQARRLTGQQVMTSNVTKTVM